MLRNLYEDKKLSAAQIAEEFSCSENKVNYWIKKHGIKKRSISEAVYCRSNPGGDPFEVREIKTVEDGFLYGLGLGLYWGEGTKSNKHSLRLGNCDPRLILKFIDFLTRIYDVKIKDLKFGLQIFSDMDPENAKEFWVDALSVSADQFQKVVVTPSRGKGSYRKKIKHGVLTVHFNNKKLRDIVCNELKKL